MPGGTLHRRARLLAELFEPALAGFRRLNATAGELWALCDLGLSRGLGGQPSDGYAVLLESVRNADEAERARGRLDGVVARA